MDNPISVFTRYFYALQDVGEILGLCLVGDGASQGKDLEDCQLIRKAEIVSNYQAAIRSDLVEPEHCKLHDHFYGLPINNDRADGAKMVVIYDGKRL